MYVCPLQLKYMGLRTSLVASFPGPARSSLAVRNSHRGPGLVHHVMSATAYVTAISLRINDVIGWASVAFHVERGSQRSQ